MSRVFCINNQMEPPPKPDESDCCNSGCNPCILDVYEEQLRKYKDQTLKLDKRNCLSQTTYVPFKLVKIVGQTWNTSIMTFQYCGKQLDDHSIVSYRPGQHLLLRGCSSHDKFTRAYTPIPSLEKDEHDPLAFTVLVKFYEDGQMSRYLKRLKIDSQPTLWRGPYGSFQINPGGYTRILMIAQGTGIAPFYGIAHEMVNDYDCETFVKLFFCCRSRRDILLREELYECGRYWNFSYEIFLSSVSEDSDDVSRVPCKYNEVVHWHKLGIDAIRTYVGKNALQVLICGNDEFMAAIKKAVMDCGVAVGDIVLF